MGLFLGCRELVEVWRLLDDAHIATAILTCRILHVLVIFTDRVALELIDAACDRFDLDWVLDTLIHYHLVSSALRCR